MLLLLRCLPFVGAVVPAPIDDFVLRPSAPDECGPAASSSCILSSLAEKAAQNAAHKTGVTAMYEAGSSLDIGMTVAIEMQQLPTTTVEPATATASVVPPSGLRRGLWMEFGAFSGRSTREIAKRVVNHASADRVYSFDSFKGLPTSWRKSVYNGSKGATFNQHYLSKGSFNLGGKPPFQDPRVEWVVGWYNESLPPFLKAHPGNVTFVHIDCDIYASTAQALSLLEPRLNPGAVLVFDELVNYPEFAQHELRALRELQQRTRRTVRVLVLAARRLMLGEPDDIRAVVRKSGEPSGSQSAAVQLL